MTDRPDLGRIANRAGELLEFVHVPASRAGAHTVVIGHGLTSAMDRPWQVELASQLHSAGFGSLRFSFSGNGGSEGAFLDSCPTKELGDLGAVLNALERAGVGPLAYAGHSMGALVGVLAVGRGEERIRALVSLAGMVHSRAFAEVHLQHLELGGPIVGKADKPLGRTLLDDLVAIESSLPHAHDLGRPWLLVHGDQDDVVPASDSIEAAAAAGVGAELVLLEGHDHSFTEGREVELARVVVDWFRELDRRLATGGAAPTDC